VDMELITTFLLNNLNYRLYFYLFNEFRIKQLEKELDDLRNRVTITDEELTRLSKDIEDFKK